MGVPKGKGKAAAPTPEQIEQQKADQARDQKNRGIVIDLVGGKTSAKELAAVIRAHPRYEADILAFVMDVGGNSILMSVYDELDKLDAAAPEPTDAVAGVPGIAELGAGGQQAVDDRRSGVLPYDGKGGWNAVLINQNLGQYDAIPGTDNDGDRCAFATILAAKVFDGPQVFGTWLGAFKSLHGGSGILMNEKQKIASQVIDKVSEAIKAGTATYRDLSWLQEALYDYSVTALNTEFRNKEGVGSSSEVITSATDAVGSGGGTHASAADVMTAAKEIPKGKNMLVEWSASHAGGKAFRHEMMISNHAGKLQFYNAEGHPGGGSYLVELTPGALAPYFDDKKFVGSKFKVANTVSTKEGLPTT